MQTKSKKASRSQCADLYKDYSSSEAAALRVSVLLTAPHVNNEQRSIIILCNHSLQFVSSDAGNSLQCQRSGRNADPHR